MTRAAIKLIKKGEEDLYFYSHADGYPTGILVEIIHLPDKDFYPSFVDELRKRFDEIYSFPGDIDYGYVIDWDEQIIETYDAKWDIPSKRGLIRKDMLYTDVLEIED